MQINKLFLSLLYMTIKGRIATSISMMIAKSVIKKIISKKKGFD
jgi:hypothetical protein